ncbi:nicotinamide mononucleotide (NMN) deamidase PncC [Paraburkholderia bannensis]|uniref:Nicotinamide mononucleotide (NMN) deamidase PncC n=1 Tax=Paraburkholderia bannensis TaxID=765414 RepID=A0A7W9WWE2_9BURK|nr:MULTISPECIES: CinA family protein [Paraburkholderia]MBB3261804.1 nicotinamide mononucleotide (NMN) deamidase PncC [Paraburkholderia sp. WP4_3_2]MBB6106799.1 nicotinamide mononucleotide (NMN) deamidase PncC [Paraburkholderia bannensis]
MNISRQIAGFLKSRELVLASLETCTAGTIAAALADLPGAAVSLDIGIVVHSARALAAWPDEQAQRDASEAVSESRARAVAEALLAQRAGHATVALASLGWLAPEEGCSTPVAHCFAWACRDRGEVVSASETVLFSGRRTEVSRSIARRALLGLPRFVDSVFARERAG